MPRILRENGLSIVFLSFFVIFWAGQSFVGHREHNNEQRAHMQPEISYASYLRSAHFWEATAENWESEFLQMVGVRDADRLPLSRRAPPNRRSRTSESRSIGTRATRKRSGRALAGPPRRVGAEAL